jgi:hypothetical protein
MAIKLAKFRDVANGLQPGQFAVGDRTTVNSIADVDPKYKMLMDKPFACVMAVMGSDGRPNLTPMWFDYEGDKVLVNVASQRTKTKWIRKTPKITIIIVNPENMYHWMSMKAMSTAYVTHQLMSVACCSCARLTALQPSESQADR